MASGKTLRKIKYALRVLPDKCYIRLYYFSRFGRFCNFRKPQTFNEKLQWLKLHDRNPAYTAMADKFEAKKYVAGKIGEEYIIPTLGVWNSFDDIDFDKLPGRFVLKCTHDSEGLVIVTDKNSLDIPAARNNLNAALSRNFYYIGREWPYKDIKPRIIAEEYLEDPAEGGLRDYKFWCFDGRPRLVLVCSDRFSEGGLKETFYDGSWNKMDIGRPGRPCADRAQDAPKHLELMKSLASELSENLPFLRVDFYETGGRVYFGELTFYPASGMKPFVPAKWDLILGSWLTLPDRN